MENEGKKEKKQIKKMKTNRSEQETQTWPQYTTIYNLNQMQLNDQHRRHKSLAS